MRALYRDRYEHHDFSKPMKIRKVHQFSGVWVGDQFGLAQRTINHFESDRVQWDMLPTLSVPGGYPAFACIPSFMKRGSAIKASSR